LPYDRPRTAMQAFSFCPACANAYHDPADRRFHAQTLACAACGPQLYWTDATGYVLAREDAALRACIAALHAGQIVALKGIGGYQLLVDAGNPRAVARLRERKQRPRQPFALLLRDIAMVQRLCRVSAAERAALQSAAAPIVLLSRRDAAAKEICDAVAPDLPWWGVMLPYSGLHHLLMAEFDGPLVATSGNRHGEPICIDPTDALTRLQGIADYWLHHDRPILNALDDSVVRELAGAITLLRRARGYAPQAIALPNSHPPTLALGGHMKATVALAIGSRAVLSPHLGDLEDLTTREHWQRTVETLPRLLQVELMAWRYDAHPGYFCHQWARERQLPGRAVPHHAAHAAACLIEHGITPPVLAIVWDGTGWGEDGTLWGGEWLLLKPGGGYRRLGHWRPFPLPGGGAAILEPWRSLLGLCYSWLGAMTPDALPPAMSKMIDRANLEVLLQALARLINCPMTSSVGRLFDAISALLGFHGAVSYEGEAAIALEALATQVEPAEATAYPVTFLPSATGDASWVIDGAPLIKAVWADHAAAITPAVIARRFHRSLAEAACRGAERGGVRQVILTGGCFQNALLTDEAVRCLEQRGFQVFLPRRVPPNDGGIALGQLWFETSVGRTSWQSR